MGKTLKVTGSSFLKTTELILEPGVWAGHGLHDGGVVVADVGLGGGAHVLAPLQSRHPVAPEPRLHSGHKSGNLSDG